ncbi:2-dehydropantoate 2-reductase [Pseudocercospora fuligena]|uniref:2-dehydropantoate 2-reductase n=1 Tax=Pseudocercospora fuligena TaxID=685502 RepID=A0A8H6RPS9_9PEZI|nr:2-dehydropantoate 2-reductase [Pseudocercospora fuligena]
MPSNHILIIGAGSLGAFFASRFATTGAKVSAICRSNFKAVQSEGFKVTSSTFPEQIVHPTYTFSSRDHALELKKKYDIAWNYFFIATKVIQEAGDPSELLDGLVDENSAIVLIQNGLGIEEAYRKRFPRTPIISAVTRASCAQILPLHVQHKNWTRTTIGPYAPNADEDFYKHAEKKTSEFAALLKQAGIPDVDLLDHTGMQFARWHKTGINAAMNPASCLSLGPTNQAMASDEELYIHQTGVMREILAAASAYLAKPVPKDLPDVDWVFMNAREDVSGSKPSMWSDWEAGRKVELEVILGNPLRRGREVGIEMPRTQSLYALLRMAQRMRDDGR